MSKKTRKKTSKTPAKSTMDSPAKSVKKPLRKSSKPSPAKPARAPSKAAAKKTIAKIPRATSDAPRKAAAAEASHKAPLKALKPSAPEPQAGLPPTNPAAGNASLAEGAKAPAFRLPRDGGDIVSLADYAGKKLVLFFYPRADTAGCTKEAMDFSRLASAFAQSQTAVLGVSADPVKAQEAFRNKHELSVPLVSDEQHTMLEAYGVWGEKSMYGKVFQGILRTTVLIGADGRVSRIWRNVRVDGHADEVLAAVQSG